MGHGHAGSWGEPRPARGPGTKAGCARSPNLGTIQRTVVRPEVSRLTFVAAVALIAAAAGDILVESIANTGVLGRGFADNDHSSVLPALAAGVLFVLPLVVCRYMDIARNIADRSPLQDAHAVLAVQFALLFLMESAEQLTAQGRLLGGTAWLGGPVWFSLGVHVLLGLACMLAIASGSRAIARRCLALVRVALELIVDAYRCAAVFAHRVSDDAFGRSQIAGARTHGVRGPPLLLTIS